jgi:hypothetical protein
MPTFGETDLLADNRVVGTVRVLHIHSGQAVLPRLSIGLGFTLRDFPATRMPPDVGLSKFELRGLSGEVRLEENSKPVGVLSWIGSHQSVRSSAFGSEGQVQVACDLDWPRFDAIEEHRKGKEASFWLALWPTIVHGAEYLDSEIRPFRVQVPRESWLAYTEQLTGVRRSLVEITAPFLPSNEFSSVVAHLAEAQKRANAGDFDESVASCRRAIEATLATLNVPNNASELEARLTPATDSRRAKAYSGILAKLKELGNATVHRPEAPGLYSRAEACFAVATTAHMIGLLTTLLRTPRSDA